jgi:hypothetical protein
MAIIPDSEPSHLTPGTTVKFRRVLADYPAPVWALTYHFRQGTVAVSAAGATDGSAHLVTVPPADTAQFAAGTIYWQATVTDDLDTYLVGRGQITAHDNLTAFANGDDYDGRTQAERDLAAVRGAIRALLDGGAVQEYAIGNRSLRRYDLTQLRELEQQLSAQVRGEQNAARMRAGGALFGEINYRIDKP